MQEKPAFIAKAETLFARFRVVYREFVKRHSGTIALLFPN